MEVAGPLGTPLGQGRRWQAEGTMLVWRNREWTAGKRRPSKAMVETRGPRSMVGVWLLARGQVEPQRVSNREGCEQLSVQKHQEEEVTEDEMVGRYCERASESRHTETIITEN